MSLVPPIPSATHTLHRAHAYMLTYQRLWVASRALAQGLTVLILDSDVHLMQSPFALARSLAVAVDVRPRPTPFDVLWASDDGWPILSRRDGSDALPKGATRQGTV